MCLHGLGVCDTVCHGFAAVGIESPALIQGLRGPHPASNSDSDLGGFVGPAVVDASDSIAVEPAPFQVIPGGGEELLPHAQTAHSSATQQHTYKASTPTQALSHIPSFASSSRAFAYASTMLV